MTKEEISRLEQQIKSLEDAIKQDPENQSTYEAEIAPLKKRLERLRQQNIEKKEAPMHEKEVYETKTQPTSKSPAKPASSSGIDQNILEMINSGKINYQPPIIPTIFEEEKQSKNPTTQPFLVDIERLMETLKPKPRPSLEVDMEKTLETLGLSKPKKQEGFMSYHDAVAKYSQPSKPTQPVKKPINPSEIEKEYLKQQQRLISDFKESKSIKQKYISMIDFEAQKMDRNIKYIRLINKK